MATLSKGMSYRRQGSSGLIWADQMVVTEDGTLLMNRQLRNDSGFLRNSPRMAEAMDSTSGTPAMARSKTVGSTTSSVTIVPPAPAHKSSFRVLKWLKKAFTKMRR